MIDIFYEYNTRGPGKVIENLKKGLSKLDEGFRENPNAVDLGNSRVFLQNNKLLNGDTVKGAIIGPNICTIPPDNGIVMGKQYKKLLVPSKWVKDLYLKWIPEDKIDIWPVGVDSDYFSDKSSENKKVDCLIYFKRRNIEELFFIEKLLKNLRQSYVLIKYGSYEEADFIDAISKSKYGFVIDNCESQGLAIQEMMSCNLPLFVWDVSTWSDKGPEHLTPSTSIPFWDDRCGASVIDKNKISEEFNVFLKNIDKYKPRDYILENLTLEKKAKDLVNLFK
jgi:hypothetical protein